MATDQRKEPKSKTDRCHYNNYRICNTFIQCKTSGQTDEKAMLDSECLAREVSIIMLIIYNSQWHSVIQTQTGNKEVHDWMDFAAGS